VPAESAPSPRHRRPHTANVMKQPATWIGILILLFAGWLLYTGFANFGTGGLGNAVPFVFGGMFTLFIGSVFLMKAFAGGIHRGILTQFRRLMRPDLTNEIERLAKLRADGYISGEEFEKAKKRLLEDI
jgi:hypothetical protein